MRIYQRLLLMNLSALTQYRENFINSMASSVIWSVFTFIQIILLTSKTSTLFGWSRNELLILSCVQAIIIGIFHTMFTRNFEQLPRLIRYGQLDTMLMKPLDSHIQVSIFHINYTSLVRVAIGAALLVFLLYEAHIIVTCLNVLLFLSFICFGVILLFSIWSIVVTMLFWNPSLSNLIDVMFTVSSLSKYPGDMYRQLSQYIFFFLLPFTFIAISPTKVLLQHVTLYDSIGLLGCCIGFLFLARSFWKFALRYYTSASS
jgi:ABC-2 type transport system permease protein